MQNERIFSMHIYEQNCRMYTYLSPNNQKAIKMAHKIVSREVVRGEGTPPLQQSVLKTSNRVDG